MRRRITFSRNLTLSLSRTCRCYCKYCSFATHGPHLYSPEEVVEMLDGAARRRVKELLVLTGERPEVNAAVRERLASYGHDDFTGYVVWTCERALERGLLPHTNLGVLAREDLARLREVSASQGLMLESISERLMDTVHAGSPTKHPAAAPGDDPRRRRAEDPVHERHPGRDRGEPRGAAGLAAGARGGARRVRAHPGGDPAELRPPPALLRARAGRRSPTRRLAATGRPASADEPVAVPLPAWATPVTVGGDGAAGRRDARG